MFYVAFYRNSNIGNESRELRNKLLGVLRNENGSLFLGEYLIESFRRVPDFIGRLKFLLINTVLVNLYITLIHAFF